MRLSKDPHDDRDERQRVDETQVKGEGGLSPWRPPVLWLLLALAAGIVIAIYSCSFQAPFYFDDYPNIRDNTHMHLKSLSPKALLDAAFKSPCRNRPLANITLALNYYFGGTNVFGYHLVNVVLHILTGLLLFVLVRDTLALARAGLSSKLAQGQFDPSAAALFTTLIWLVNPVQTQAVTYIVQRMAVMATLFLVLSLVCYVRGRMAQGTLRWVLYAGSAASCLAGLASKEIAATLPVFVFIYEWYFFRDLDMAWVRKKLVWIAGLAAFMGVMALLYVGTNIFTAIHNVYAFRGITMSQRVMTELRVVLIYLGQILFPHPSRLSLEHEVPLSFSLIDPPTTAFSLVVLLGLAIAAVLTAKKERLVSFAILWYLGNHVIESTVLPLEIFFEHRSYLPSMFVVALVPVAVMRYARPKWAGVAVLCVVAGVFSVWTCQRNMLWSDKTAMLRDGVAKVPESPRTHNNLGLRLLDTGHTDEAIAELSTALRLSPNRYSVYDNLAKALSRAKRYQEAVDCLQQGMLLIQDKYDKVSFLLKVGNAYEKMGKLPEAQQQYRQALALDPESEKALVAAGKAYTKQGLFAEALEQLDEAVRVNPRSADAYLALGNLQAQQGRADEALRQYDRSLELVTANPDAHFNMANILLERGSRDEAVGHLEEALRIDPSYGRAHVALATLAFSRGELDKALAHAQDALKADPGDAEAAGIASAAQARRQAVDAALAKMGAALQSDPDNPQFLFQQAEVLRMGGLIGEAIAGYERALSLRPGFPQALKGLAVAYSLAGDRDRAIAALKKIVELSPGDPDAYYNLACQYSLKGDRDEAVRWLSRAVGKGFRGWDLMKKDNDLYNIRQTDYFKKLAAGK